MIHVNEYRQLRDAYGIRAAAALARAYGIKTGRWVCFVEAFTADPFSYKEALELYAEGIHCFCDWGVILRFGWFAEKVWEMEVQELYGRMTGTHEQKT